MLKKSIARLFCIVTVFLLTSNVVLAAVPFSKTTTKQTIKKDRFYSPYLEIDQDSTYIAEKDPFEDLDFLISFSPIPYFLFPEFDSQHEVKHFYSVSGPFIKSSPIWLLVQRINV
jgi:hypothetical protein